MAAGRLDVTLPSDLEIRMTRMFDAPRRLVWEAYTRPEHLRRWWGRRGSTLSVCEADVRPGGRWRFVERAADGQEWGFRGEYREIVAPEKIVQTFVFEPMPDKEVVETLTLVEQDGRTLLTTLSRFASKADRDGMLQSGMEEGANESMDRLDELVAAM